MAEGEPQPATVTPQQGITATTITKYLLQNIAPSLLLVSGLFYFVSNRMDTLAIALETRIGASITRLDNSVIAANQRIDGTAAAANQRIDASVAMANQRIDATTQRLDLTASNATTEIRALEDSFASLDSEIKTSVKTLNAAVTSAADKLQSLKSVTDRLRSSKSSEYVESFKLGENFVSGMHFGRTLVFPRTNDDDNISRLRARGFRQTEFQVRGTTIHGWIPSRRAANNLPRVVDLPAELLDVLNR